MLAQLLPLAAALTARPAIHLARAPPPTVSLVRAPPPTASLASAAATWCPIAGVVTSNALYCAPLAAVLERSKCAANHNQRSRKTLEKPRALTAKFALL